MKVLGNKIVECTENELYSIYLERGYDDVMSFSDYKYGCMSNGTKLIEEKGSNET